MQRHTIIQKVINKIQAKVYLEIGVQRGKNFYSITAAKKVAVDPHFMIGVMRRLKNPLAFFNSSFFEVTSDQFFEDNAALLFKHDKIDVAFIDGLHTYGQSLRDFFNCARHLSTKGVILFHDCNPDTESAAAPVNSPTEMREKFSNAGPAWNGDVWKTITHIRTLPDWQVFVLDCDNGIGIAVKKPNQNRLSYDSSQIEGMEYHDLAANRESFLGLKKPEYLDEFLTQF
jgi:hypothetical protein